MEVSEVSAKSMTVVFSAYGLVRNILKNLPMRDLKRFARVNKLFKTACEATMKDLKKNSWPEALFIPLERSTPDDFQDSVESRIKSFMNETYMDPAAALIISTSDLENWVYAPPSSDTSLAHILDPDKLKKLLPSGCASVSIMNEGIVTRHVEDSKPLEIENVNVKNFDPAANVMLFPKSPNYQVIPFSVGEKTKDLMFKKKEFRSDPTNKSKDPCATKELFREFLYESSLGKKIADPSDIKCVLVLTSSNEMPHLTFLLQEIYNKTKGKVAIGGALGFLARSSEDSDKPFQSLIEETQTSDPPLTSTGLVFAGAGVEAASVIVDRNVRNAKGVLEALTELKSAGLDETHSVGFMFACCGRGNGLYRKNGVESKAFQKVFPKTPLMGFFGGGEVGLTCIHKKEDTDNKDSFSHPGASSRPKLLMSGDLLHSYTTVFVLLSFTK